MYNEFYGLQENPFSISPDPKYFYFSERHNQAFAHLSYGLKSGGAFVLLTGEVGTGKTTVSRRILNILPEDTALATIYHPTDEPRELYACICDEFHLAYSREATIKDLFNILKEFFFSASSLGRQAVIVIDEAQMLSENSLEQLRLLTNLETDNKKAVQIVLIGQPELQELLSRPSLRQLSQRITARFHITPLEFDDVGAYLRFRLQVAGRIQPLFHSSAVKLIARFSQGVPRLINLVADRSIEEGTSVQSRIITVKEVKKAISFILPARNKVVSSPDLSGGISYRNGFKIAGIMVLFILFLGMGILASLWAGPVKDITMPEPVITEEYVDNEAEYQKSRDDQRDFLYDVRAASSREDAVSSLFKVWGYNDSHAVCDNASLVGLFCYDFRGSLQNLFSANHPAVVRLYDKQSLTEFYGVIIGANNESVKVIINGNLYKMDKSFFAGLYDGDGLIISRLFPSGTQKLSRNSPAKDFRFLSLALSRALRKKDPYYRGYTQELTEDVKTFQRQEGLEEDGLVGLQTLLLLNARGGTNMNRLTDIFPE